MRGQNGVEFYRESTGHVRFFLALLLADQWEAENPNFLVIWPTDKYEGSKWLNVYCQDASLVEYSHQLKQTYCDEGMVRGRETDTKQAASCI